MLLKANLFATKLEKINQMRLKKSLIHINSFLCPPSGVKETIVFMFAAFGSKEVKMLLSSIIICLYSTLPTRVLSMVAIVICYITKLPMGEGQTRVQNYGPTMSTILMTFNLSFLPSEVVTSIKRWYRQHTARGCTLGSM